MRAVMKQSPVSIEFPNSKAARAFGEIAQTLVSEEDGTGQKGKKGIAGLFSNFMSKRKFR